LVIGTWCFDIIWYLMLGICDFPSGKAEMNLATTWLAKFQIPKPKSQMPIQSSILEEVGINSKYQNSKS